MKLFSTRTHGMLDYVTAAKLVALPRMLGWSEGLTQWMTGMAIGTTAYSALTRYELGAVKVLPMQGHLALDFLNGLTFCAAPLLFPKENTTVKAALVGIGLFEIAASLMTETEPSYSEQASQFGDDSLQTFQEFKQELRERVAGT
jgi:hypothetical protein